MSRSFYVRYSFVADIVERREPHRSEHLEMVRRSFENGELVLAAAFADPIDGAILVMQACSESDVRGWVHADPYFRAGLVTGVEIRRLNLGVRPPELTT